MGELSDILLGAIGKHFISISCAELDVNNEPVQAFVFSAFVIEIVGEWFLLTAGHVLTEIERARAAGKRLDVWRLGDQTGNRRFGSGSVPFDYNAEDWLVIDNRDTGLDYAALPLRPIYRAALVRAGIEPIREHVWDNPWTDDFERRALIGIPAESVHYDGNTQIRLKITLAPMSPTTPPAFTEEKADNQFYSKLDDDPLGVIQSIEGMSGGPIFSCKREGDVLRYRLLGIQSSWYKSDRITAGCPVATFAKAVEEALRQHGIAD